jgi:DNA-nicking Smr family endonuclease
MGNFISAYKETEAGAAWREKAQGFNDQRSIAFEKSQIAYQQGNHAMAKHWSTTGKTLGQKMEDANERAAKAIFDSLNKAGAHPPRTYDFHGLHVKECLRKLDELTKYAQRQKWSDMTIIVGRGNHSLHGIAKVSVLMKSDFSVVYKVCSRVLIHC